MVKTLMCAAALGALIIDGVATPALAGQVYGNHGQYDPDAPYQGGGEGGYDHDNDYATGPRDGYRHRDDRVYGYRQCEDRTVAGTGVGAVLGGVIGNQFGHGGGRVAATVGGVILGGLAGNAIARDSCRDEYADAYYYNRAYYDGFESRRYGSAYAWRNPYNGHYGSVTPTRVTDGDRHGYGGDCREFKQTIYIDGRRTQAYGTACRNPDGSWQIINDD